MGTTLEDDNEIKKILEDSKVVAVVGLSGNPERPSYRVANYLKNKGFKVVPVNPNIDEVLGQKSLSKLEEYEGIIDIVDVFRRPEDALSVARDAIRKGAKVLWLQEGVINEEAARIAASAGLKVVMDRCIMKEHQRLMG